MRTISRGEEIDGGLDPARVREAPLKIQTDPMLFPNVEVEDTKDNPDGRDDPPQPL